MNQGGGVAAPVAGKIFSEILPYLDVEIGNKDEIEERIEVEVPNVIGMSISEGEKILEEKGLTIFVNNQNEEDNKDEIIITQQVPSEKVKVYQGSCIYLN